MRLTLEAGLELATRLAQGPTVSLSLIKYLVIKGLETDFEESLKMAHLGLDQTRRTEDHKEAVQAFLEKRQPKFTGR